VIAKMEFVHQLMHSEREAPRHAGTPEVLQETR
jgi:hypothetical protein